MWGPREGFFLDGGDRWSDPSSKGREQGDAGWSGGINNHRSSGLERMGWLGSRGHVDRLVLDWNMEMQAGPGRWGESGDEMYAILSVFIFSNRS